MSSTTSAEAFTALTYYTLAHGDPAFIHQYIVDTYAAQQADETSKPIYVAFALAGLYLHNVKKFSGRQVQRAHMQLAKHKEHIPLFQLPVDRGTITIVDVLQVPPGPERDRLIEEWSASTWNALQVVREEVVNWLKQELDLESK